MCDIYTHVCDHEGCAFSVELHLANFDTGRDEIEIYCENHMPKDKEDGVVWKIVEGKSRDRFFMRCLSQKARDNWNGNNYNGDCETVEVFGEKRVYRDW